MVEVKILHQVNAHFAGMFAPVGLCITLVLEIGLIKAGADDFDKQCWCSSVSPLSRSFTPYSPTGM